MDKQKVLMVGPDRGVHGGISAVVNEFYNAGFDEKVDIKYIGTMKEGSKLKKLFVAAFAYVRFLSELKWCDIVHVHFSSDSSFIRKSLFIRKAHKAGKKIVLHQHGGDFTTFYNKQLNDAQKKKAQEVLNMGDVMLVLTKTWKEFFSHITDTEIVVFPNGICVNEGSTGADDEFPLSGNDNKADVSAEGKSKCDADIIDKDYKSIIFLGRICRDKGITELLEAMDSLHAGNPQLHLYIGGIYEDEYYREEVEKRSEYVTYLGWITGKDKEQYLKKCGILVLPSYFEGFGMTLIEGMLWKTAVIGSNVGGIPDIIDDGENGILIPARDKKALEEAILSLVSDIDLATRLGSKGREKVLNFYSVEKNIEKLIALYRKL